MTLEEFPSQEEAEQLKTTIEDFFEQLARSNDKDEFLTNTGETEEGVLGTLRSAWERFSEDVELADMIRGIDRLMNGYITDALEEGDDDPLSEIADEEEM